MTIAADKLKSMADNADSKVAALDNSIASVEDQADQFTKDKDAVEQGIAEPTKETAIDIIENTILIDKGGDSVNYGSDFGKINWDPLGNLTDWEILDATGNVIYTYTEGDYTDLDDVVDDYAFANDQLTRPLTDGATYGIIPNIDILGNASDILNENADNAAASKGIYNKYAS